MAHFDHLTQVANRSLFNQALDNQLTQAKEQNVKLAVLLVDLNDFKIINDTLGHSAGDILLQHVACQLKNAIPSSDLITRLGGDEFAIILAMFPKHRAILIILSV
jgi:diguanylate cyclase (GGDEF)-like protein